MDAALGTRTQLMLLTHLSRAGEHWTIAVSLLTFSFSA